MVGSISGYKNDSLPVVNIPDPLRFLLNNQSIRGFGLGGFKDLIPQYLSQLIADLSDKLIKVVLDFDQNTSEGEFKGIDSVVRGVETTDFRKAVRVVEVPLVPPQDNEVLIKNIYAGVNVTDITLHYITAARYFTDAKLPFDIGLEALGVIEAVGKGVATLQVGQPVVYFRVTPKAYSEYLYCKEKEVIPVPSLNPEFIGVLISGLIASIGLDQTGHIEKGDKVVIRAATGGAGHIAVQWAKKKGCFVIGMTSSPEQAKLLKELGTDRIIDYKTENLDGVLTKEFPSGVDVVWETIGGQVFETLLKHLAPKDRIVMVGSIIDNKNVNIPDPHRFLLNKNNINSFRLDIFKDLIPIYIKQLMADLTDKKLKVILDFGQNTSEGEFKGIDSVVRGVEHLHSGKSIGKVVIKIQND